METLRDGGTGQVRLITGTSRAVVIGQRDCRVVGRDVHAIAAVGEALGIASGRAERNCQEQGCAAEHEREPFRTGLLGFPFELESGGEREANSHFASLLAKVSTEIQP